MKTSNELLDQVLIAIEENKLLNINDVAAVASVVEPILQLDELTQKRMFRIIQIETGVNIIDVYYGHLKDEMILSAIQKTKNEKSKIEIIENGNLKIKSQKSRNLENEILKNEKHFLIETKKQKMKFETYQNKMKELQKGYMKLLINN